MSRNSNVARYHQLSTKDRYTIDISCNKTSVTYIPNGKVINVKIKPLIEKEYRIYERLYNLNSELFLTKHTLKEHPTTNYLLRHDLTALSLADLYGVVKSENWKPLYDTLPQITYHQIPKELVLQIEKHTSAPQHTCCLLCRRFLAELGLLLHKLNKQVFSTTTTILRYYNFVLTSDNVDLNGILDYEDYVEIEEEHDIEIKEQLRKMQPYYHTLYSIYEHTGMYFISQPIYDRAIENHDDLIQRYEEVIENIRTLTLDSKFEDTVLYRPTIQHFAEYMKLDHYAVKPEPLWKIYDTIKSPKIEIPGIDNVAIIIKPTRPFQDYVELNHENIKKFDGLTYCKINHRELYNIQDILCNLPPEATIQELYIVDHPFEIESYQHMLKVNLNIWLASMYDANVNLSHFDSINYERTKQVSFPVVGTLDATNLHDCEICQDMIPPDIKSVYDIGSCTHAKAQLEDYKSPRKINPLVEFDTALLEHGTFTPENDYAYTMKTKPDHLIDLELKSYLDKSGLTALIPPLNPNPIIHDPDKTFSSAYYIKTPSEASIQEDLEMFNQNTAAAVSPTVYLMATELLHQLLTETVLASDGNKNCPMRPSDVPIRNKHKSSGTPYRKYGDSEFMRELYGEHRDALVYHKRHSADQALTLVINKVAISTKHRDRTILAININKSEAGRSLFRWFLDKIKYTANTGGPILIGLIAQYGGWDKLYKNLYKDSPAENPETAPHVLLGGKDYPKWDRRISNMLQLTTTNIFFNMIDQLQQYQHNNATPSETWHEYMSETTQILYDYLVFGNKLYQKPGGVTSGNSRTADGNSFLHLLIDMYALIVQLIQSVPENVDIEAPLRSQLCKIALTVIPSDYLEDPQLRSTDILTSIRTRVAKGAYLSDDGLIVIDTRLIRYDDFMAESHMISKYLIANNKHKYHMDPIQRKAREFLSQDTFDFGDMSYPLPEFGRIYSAMLLSDNKNTLDPQINITRLLSLYAYLYIYYFKYAEQPTQNYIKLLDAIRKYIDERLETTEDQFLDCIKIPDLQDVELDLKNCDMFENFDHLWGFDLSDAYIEYLHKYKHRYPKLSIFKRQILEQYEQAKLVNKNILHNKGTYVTYNCYVCGENAHITCALCERVFCNSKDSTHGSHIEQHLQYSGHNSLYLNCKTVKCRHCYVTDINNLYTAGKDMYYCLVHKPTQSVKLLNNNVNEKLPPNLYLCITDSRPVPFYERCYENYTAIHPDYPVTYNNFMSLIQQYLYQDYTLPQNQLANRIRVRLQLSSYGIVRPYHQLIMQLTKIESKVIDASVVDIPITPTNSLEIGTCYIEVPQVTKLDQHSTYSYLLGNREVNFTPTYFRLSNKTTHIWQTDVQIPTSCTYIRQRRLNTLSAILRNTTQHVPEFTRLLMSWNQQLPIAARPFIEFIPTFRIPAQPTVAENINILLNELNVKRFKIMFGGPGTGKSHTLSILVNHLHEKGFKILIYTPSHQSANALLHKIASIMRKRNIQNPGLTRIVTDGMKEELKPNPYITYRASMLDKDRICVTTIQSFSTVQHVKDVDLVILDEFSLTSDNYLLTGLSHLKPSTRVLFSGDPRQLSGVDETRKTLKPCFHTLINYYTEIYPKEVHVLKYHFRCHPLIFKYFKDQYYADKDMECKTLAEDRIIRPLKPISTVKILDPHYKNLGVVLNQDETDKVLDILVLITQTISLHASYEFQPTTAIICSYKSQLQNFQALQQQKILPEYVKLSTIDSAQGDEFDIVILCLSQINNFTLNPNRFNVAISRAKSVLFITVPPIDKSPHFQYKDTYNKLLETEQFEYYKIYNEGSSKILLLDSPTTLRNKATFINIRNLAGDTHKLQTTFPINIVMSDYIFFDSEFLNPLENRQEPVMLSYGFTHENNKRRIAGIPMRYVKNKFNILTPIQYNFVDNDNPLTSTYSCNWLKHKDPSQFRHLSFSVKVGIKNNTTVELRHMLNYCIDNTHVKPVIVTWAGASDHCFLKANTLYPPISQMCNVTIKCKSPPIYASPQGCHTYFLCSHHAQTLKEQINITHFVNLEIIDLKVEKNVKTNETTMNVIHNGNHKLTIGLQNLTSNSLKDCHAFYCNTRHAPITPHDPLDDALMTQCLFHSIVRTKFEEIVYEEKANVAAFISMDYRLRNFNPEMCKLRRELQEYWYKKYSATTKTHCNMGCGKDKLTHALHNIDILQGKDPQNNMNTHTCNSEEHIYFDSHWYKTDSFKKPSYIFSDINNDHYYNLGTTGLSLYLNSRLAKYIHCFNPVQGTDVFKTEFYDSTCSETRETENFVIKDTTSIPDCIIHSSTDACAQNFKSFVCTNHIGQIDIISKISQATHYGYSFVKVTPTTIHNQSNLKRAPPTWDHTTLQIPGYEIRTPQSVGHMQMKALGILSMLQDSMLFTTKTKLKPNMPIIHPGAAGHYGQTALANEFKKHLKQNHIINIDPRLKQENTTNFKKTLKEMLNIGYPTEIIISDIHNNKVEWITELCEYTNKYLLETGTLIFKITSRGATEQALELLQKLSEQFTYMRVCNLNAVTRSSELWVVFANKRKPTVQGWMPHELRNELRKHWYSMTQNIITPIQRHRIGTFGYSPK